MFSIVIIIFATGLVGLGGGTAVCSTEDGRERCESVVRCRVHAGSAAVPACDDSFSPVIFYITDSATETLTSQFFGATNFDSRVTAIKAHDNAWTTIETGSLKYYTNTRSIDFSNNKIETVKDLVFKNYMQLENLNLSSNFISTFGPKTFLISESRDPPLQDLDLSHNKIKELNEDVFKYLPKLKTLHLNNNEISTISEAAFRGCPLKTLILTYNLMTAINLSFLSLPNLIELDISYNLLKKIFGYEMNRLISIVRLNLSNNIIEAVESNSFNRAFHLESLDLSNNVITSSIESVTFINNNALSYLNLYNNSISEIQENSFKHNRLKFLNFENNTLSGIIAENTFAGLTNVTSMDLHGQYVTALDKNAFSDMIHLLSLNISSNKISIIHNTSFINTTSLKILDLSNNNISTLGFLQNCLGNLSKVDLSSNNLKTIKTNTFVNQTSMTRLDLSRNKIIAIEANALPLKNLQILDLSGNMLGGSITKNMFSPAEYLRNLDLSNFDIKRIEDEAFVGLRLLAQLNLSHNAIEYIGPNNFKDMENVYNIDLSNNKLTKLEMNNTSLNNLKALYLRNNKFDSFNNTLKNISRLMYLDLSSNLISELAKLKLTNLSELKVLILSNNSLGEFNSPEIDSLPLVRLDLNINRISNINITCFKDLIILNISDNNLKQVNSSSIMNQHLQSLDLSRNALKVIDPGTFQYTTMLKFLNISHNEVSELRYGSLRGLHRAEVVDLSYNKISELEVDIFHECTEMKKLLIDNNLINNFDVEQLVMTVPKLGVVSLGSNPISCREIVRNIKNIMEHRVTKPYTWPIGRHVEVTAVDKVFHDDNVNGIRCGDSNRTQTNSVDQETNSNTYVIWCSILTVMLVAAMASGFCYMRKVQSHIPVSRVHLRDTISFGGSEFGNDV